MPLTSEQRAFLETKRFAVLGTVNQSGSPHLTVMWYLLDGDEILFNTRAGRAKDLNLARDPRASLLVMRDDGYSYLRIDGRVRTIRDQRTAHDDIRRIALRYYGDADRVERAMRDNFGKQERISYRLPTTGPEGTKAALPPSEQPWEPSTPERTAEILRDLRVPWFVAGGWALDLYIGRQTRAHGDLDLAILRGDEAALHDVLRDWELFTTDGPSLTPFRAGDALPADRHAIWARQPGHDWQLEFAVERREGDRWTYRRDPRIGAHVKDIGRYNNAGIRYLRPDIVLLYKSKSPRGVDESDVLAALPRLDAYQRATLAAWIVATDPSHRWLARLK